MAVSLITAVDWNLSNSIERYLDISFERRSLTGLKAHYSGPKKLKSSGKAAGSKKKRSKNAPQKSKTRHQAKKDLGKPRKNNTTGKAEKAGNDGFAPLMKRKKD